MSKMEGLFLRNKKNIALILGLGLFFSLIPLQPAEAVEWYEIVFPITLLTGDTNILKMGVDYLASLPFRIFALGLAVIIGIIGFFSGLLFSLATVITNWIVRATLSVGISTSNGLTPDVIKYGWEFTRDFANMFFVLILVFIGLATILKLKEYQAKKTLPLLILVVLLMNFTPVIVGFVVDIGNIFTNFFLEQVGQLNDLRSILDMFWGSGGYFQAATEDIFKAGVGEGESFVNDFGSIMGDLALVVIYGIVLIIFFIFGAIIYFFVTILFISRIVYLWALMVLAPIAFLTYIFPAAKKLYLVGWNNWWENLIKWSILGIPLGFFLYLSSYIISLRTDRIFGSEPQLVGEIGHLGAFFSKALAPIVGLALLFLGIQLSKKLAPEAALKIVEGVKKGAKIAATSAIAAATMGMGAAGLAGVMGKAAAGAARAETFLGKRRLTKPLQYLVGKPAKWATRGVERFAGEPLEKFAAKKMSVETEPGFERLPVKEQVKRYHKLFTVAEPYRKAGMLKGIVESGNWDKAVKDGLITQEDMRDVIKLGRIAWGRGDKTIAHGMPHIFTKVVVEPEKWKEGEEKIKEGEKKKKEAESKSEEVLKTKEQLKETRKPEIRKQLQDKINQLGNEASVLEGEGTNLIKEGRSLKSDATGKVLGGIKSGAIKNISESSLKDPDIKRTIVDTFTGSQMAEIGRNFGRHIVEGIQKEIQDTPFETLAKKNPNLALWLETNAAQGLGFSLPKGAVEYPRKQIRRLVHEARIESEKDRKAQKRLLEPEGPMLLRKYFRKDTSSKIKSLIEEIAMEKGKTVPPTPELEKRIGKFERIFDKLTEELRSLYQKVEEAEIKFNRVRKIPDVEPQYIVKVKAELERAKTDWNTGSVEIIDKQKKLEASEKDMLKDLW